jgi:hypothetical protein
MASKSKIMVILATIAVFGAILAPSALAQSNPFMEAWLHQPGLNGGVSESQSSNSVTILADVMLKAGTEINSPKCHWVKEGWNSGESANGELWWFKDHHMYVCPNKNSPTGWVKVKGGMTGRRCYNPVKVGEEPKKVVTGKVKLVRSFGKFKVTAKAKAEEEATGTCGKAKATAFARGVAFGLTKIQAQGNAKVVANAKARASAYAKAVAILQCAPPATPPPATPPTTPPSEQPKAEPESPYVNLETIQEVETNEERLICAHVESPHSDPVTVHFEAEFGTFANGGTGGAVSGGKSCLTYTGPTDLPNNYGYGSYDFIEVMVWDTVTGKSAWDFEAVEIISQTKF